MSGPELVVAPARPEDAAEILELLKIVGGETDNLSFGGEGLPVSAEEERAYLASAAGSDREIFLTARLDGALAGTAHYASFPKKRMAHRGEIGISVRRSAWGLGVGARLMEELLRFAGETARAEIVSLEVRSDNQRAIRLYRRFGFEKIGCFRGYFKIDGALVDFDLMEKLL